MRKKHIIISIICFCFIFSIAPLGQSIETNRQNTNEIKKENEKLLTNTSTNCVPVSQDLFYAPNIETIKPPKNNKNYKSKSDKKKKTKTKNNKKKNEKTIKSNLKTEKATTQNTIYDSFSDEELELLFRIVETEVRDNEYFDEKANVCSVIFNRLKHDDFPDTLTGVLTQKYQFSSYGGGKGYYRKVTITDMTIAACEYVFKNGDTTNGALWFDSTNGNSWANKHKTYMFTDGVGHAFYK